MVRKSRLLLAPVAFATGLFASAAEAGGRTDTAQLAEAVASGQCLIAEASSGNTKGPSHDERVVSCRLPASEIVVELEPAVVPPIAPELIPGVVIAAAE